MQKKHSFFINPFSEENFYTENERYSRRKRITGKRTELCDRVSLPIGKNNVLMASDIMESAGQRLIPGNNYYIFLHTESRSEADQLFEKLSQNGAVEMPMEDMFWGDYFGCLKDQFGIQWMISFNETDQ